MATKHRANELVRKALRCKLVCAMVSYKLVARCLSAIAVQVIAKYQMQLEIRLAAVQVKSDCKQSKPYQLVVLYAFKIILFVLPTHLTVKEIRPAYDSVNMKETTPTFPLLASRGLPPRPLPPRTACMPPFPALEAEWNITQHIYPAAFPRSKKGSTVSKSSNRLGRISAQEIDQLAEDVLQRQYQAEYTDLNEIKDVQALWIAVNRYKPNAPPPQGKKGITLTFAHANGMHKEVSSRHKDMCYL